MNPIEAHLIYAPFNRALSGHVAILFRFSNGRETVISPEAQVMSGETFSLLQGLRKKYRLQFALYEKEAFFTHFASGGRSVREYRLNFDKVTLQRLHEHMLVRSRELAAKHEWYHTLLNSCITNTLRQVDAARAPERSRPKSICMLWATISPKSIAKRY